jgi:uroporphyrinogen III methyltransferase/synthase
MENKKRILNTRPEAQAGKLSELLSQAGFEPVEVPLVSIVPYNQDGLRAVDPSDYTGLFLSSANGLRIFREFLPKELHNEWIKKPLYTLSSGISSKWEELGGIPGFCSGQSSLEGFLDEFNGADDPGNQMWLHPCSLKTRLDPGEFKKKQITVHNFPVYAPSLPDGTEERLQKELPGADAILFFSGSAVENFFQCLESWKPEAAIQALKGKQLFCLGPSAAQALEKQGVTGYHRAKRTDNEGMVEVLKGFYD